jgi:hypothetical protein
MYYTGEGSKGQAMKWLRVAWISLALVAWAPLGAETCTTQSQMKEADRNLLANSAAMLAAKVAADDSDGVKALTIADFRSDFSPMASAIASTALHVHGSDPEVEQVYMLDASNLAKPAGGGNPDAQFFCSLNNSPAEAQFAIPQLPPGQYAFAMVRMQSATPWRLSFLLRQESGTWLLAGFYPKQLTASGHDGLWYWQQARSLAAQKQPWNAWLYYQEAAALLYPAPFVSSTHLDKLQNETSAAMPPAVSGGLGADAPLVVKGADGTEFRFTSLGVNDSLHAEKIDVVAHLKVDELGDAAVARKRNIDAMTALLAAHPELRQSFHGVFVAADAPNQTPFVTQLDMTEIK